MPLCRSGQCRQSCPIPRTRRVRRGSIRCACASRRARATRSARRTQPSPRPLRAHGGDFEPAVTEYGTAHAMTRPENRILSPDTSWSGFNFRTGGTPKWPAPQDSYSGAREGAGGGWGTIDDTCDVIVQSRADLHSGLCLLLRLGEPFRRPRHAHVVGCGTPGDRQAARRHAAGRQREDRLYGRRADHGAQPDPRLRASCPHPRRRPRDFRGVLDQDKRDIADARGRRVSGRPPLCRDREP